MKASYLVRSQLMVSLSQRLVSLHFLSTGGRWRRQATSFPGRITFMKGHWQPVNRGLGWSPGVLEEKMFCCSCRQYSIYLRFLILYTFLLFTPVKWSDIANKVHIFVRFFYCRKCSSLTFIFRYNTNIMQVFLLHSYI